MCLCNEKLDNTPINTLISTCNIHNKIRKYRCHALVLDLFPEN